MSITSANSVVTMTVAGLFPAPVQLQGFSADRAWETSAVAQTESVIGVDGRKTSGFIFNVVEQTFTLQGDSPSKFFFTQITNAQRAARDTLRIDANIVLPSTGESFTCKNGTLQSSKILPDGGKMLSDMDYVIVWESIQPTLS